LTKTKNNEEPDRMADNLSRIKMQSKEISMVKLADRIINLQTPPGHRTNEKNKLLERCSIDL
jgi:guanosine-3',5'-bis(diphosphate) 3'-pyrophosphohydrolase